MSQIAAVGTTFNVFSYDAAWAKGRTRYLPNAEWMRYMLCKPSYRGGGMHWPQTGATQYHTQVGLPDKNRAIIGLFVCNNWDLDPLDLLNGLALGCYRPSP